MTLRSTPLRSTTLRSTTLHPAPGTELFFLDAEGVLFCEPRQELHHFNTMAAVIWCHLEDGLDAAAIAAALQASHGLDPDAAARFVAAALDDWQAKHLLGAGLPIPPPPPEAPVHEPPPPDWTPTVALRCAVLDTVLTLRFAAAAEAALVEPALRHLRSDRPATATLDIVATADGFALHRPDRAAIRCSGLHELAPIVVGAVWVAALTGSAFLAEFHAGVVTGRAGCVLLPALAGSGKSTLTTALVQAGYGYFSDEVALLRTEDLALRPCPMPICIKTTGIAPLAPLVPGLADLPVHRRAGDGKHVVYLPPPAARLPAADATAAACGVVFPRYVAGAATQWRAVSAAEALARLLDQCLYLPHGLTLASVRRLVGWIGRLPAAELTYSALPEAVAAVGAWLDGGD